MACKQSICVVSRTAGGEKRWI